jgi:uncharacterized membrane protein required for colicin V production
MVSLNVVFWLLIIIFAIIGGIRGWAREILVTFSVILAAFILTVLERFVPFVRDTLPITAPTSLFWLRSLLLLALVFFGYQTPNLPRIAQSGRFVREHLQDILLGFFLGAINGFMIWGTIWYNLDAANYPFSIILPPDPNSTMGQVALRLMPYLAPHWLGTPAIYFAVAIAFVFVMVVFL